MVSKKLCVWRRARAKFAPATLEFLAKFSRFRRAVRSTFYSNYLPIVRCVRRRTWKKLSLESAQRLALQNRAGRSVRANFPVRKFANRLQTTCKSVAFLMLSAPKLRTASLRQRYDVGVVLDRVGGVFGVEKVVRLASLSRKICVGNA